MSTEKLTTPIGDFDFVLGAYPLGAKTPNVDRFASEALVLQSYSPEAQCTPTRSALMTGRQATSNGWSSHGRTPLGKCCASPLIQ